MIQTKVTPTIERHRNLYQFGITHLIHVLGSRGATYSFYRNAQGFTWSAVNKHVPQEVEQAAQQAK